MNTPSRTAVLLSGGAPTLHFVAGAMSAFYRSQLRFDVIAASGAGALPGLLYAAPKNGKPLEALRDTVELNVVDLIYESLPMNYKVFQKVGPLTEPIWRIAKQMPYFDLEVENHYQESIGRLYNDWVQLLFALATPTSLNYQSQSMCTRIQSFLDDIVDWDALTCYPGEYCLNAFNLDEDRLEVFGKQQINSSTFFAALAMCWLYPPTVIGKGPGATTFTEGASHDPAAIEALWINGHTEPYFDEDNDQRIERIIAVETVVPDLWHDPRDLYDSLALTIMDPLVVLSEQMLGVYGRLEWELNQLGVDMPKLYIVPFEVPSWEEARALDWNYSNGLMLWGSGEASARRLCRALDLPVEEKPEGNRFDDDDEPQLEDFRYHRYFHSEEGKRRRERFLSLFDPLYELLRQSREP